VINLGHDWQADWGGLLQFFDESGQVTESFVPRYNTLSLFRVPQLHAVSLVAPWAERPRFGITGWFQS
jgi:Rps23 Pro-64 3,4-dihydroxylase Tpa1-like proline 4-hydroxylase